MSHAMRLDVARAVVAQVKLTGRLSRTFDQSPTSWGGSPWFTDEIAIKQFEADAKQIKAVLTGERHFERVGNNLTIWQAVSNAGFEKPVTYLEGPD